MRRVLLLVAWVFMSRAASFDASPQPAVAALAIEVGADEPVAAALPARPLVEPHLATSPRDPQHLVGAATVGVKTEADLSQLRCVAIASFDGARTWVAHEFDFPGCEDPWVAVLDDGSAVFIALENRDHRIAHLWLYRSADGGRTWTTPPHSFGPDHDHATLAVDRSGGRFHGALYVASFRAARDAERRSQSKTFIARSMDGGRTFVQVAEHDVTNLNYSVMTAGVLPDGTLLVPLSTHHRYVADRRSIVPLKSSLFWVVRSDDGGAHVSPPMLISDFCSPVRGFPSLAVDPSGRRRVYAMCYDGGRAGPFVFRSDDGGNRWSDPVHVPKTLPADATGQRRVTDLVVNKDGVLAVSWHDRGPDPASKCWDLFVAFSADGETFSDAQKVSTRPSCPATSGNGWAAERHPAGGDYNGLAAAADGVFHLLWADSRDDVYRLRTAAVRVTR